MFLTLNEVVERYRGQISEGTLRNWRSMRIRPSSIKIGKAILYPLEELDRWDRRNLVVCVPDERPVRAGVTTPAPATEGAPPRQTVQPPANGITWP
jgi:hypothetical protein